jgi:Protein of unknown function (DUF2550)
LAGGQLALDAGWLLALVLLVAVACATVIAARRTLIERGGGRVDCGLRRARGRRWRLGLAAYRPEDLAWYPVFGVRLRPQAVFDRRALSVVARRPADAMEAASLGPGTVVVECETGPGDARIELALGEDALTGFLAWLEAAPPGPVSEFG